MQIIKIISQHKRARGHFNAYGEYFPAKPIAKGMRRVEAIVREHGTTRTRHIDIPFTA